MVGLRRRNFKKRKIFLNSWIFDHRLIFQILTQNKVPDLYRGKVATDNEEAQHHSSNLDWAGAIQDIQGAVNHLKSIGCESIGVIGFCMGGALSLKSAVAVSGLKASVFFYGIPGGLDVSQIKIPIQVFFF
jgi:carboxymethylenebutenolidase